MITGVLCSFRLGRSVTVPGGQGGCCANKQEEQCVHSSQQIDPLVSVAQREKRDTMMAPYQNKPLSQKYMAFRSITQVLKGE